MVVNRVYFMEPSKGFKVAIFNKFMIQLFYFSITVLASMTSLILENNLRL